MLNVTAIRDNNAFLMEMKEETLKTNFLRWWDANQEKYPEKNSWTISVDFLHGSSYGEFMLQMPFEKPDEVKKIHDVIKESLA